MLSCIENPIRDEWKKYLLRPVFEHSDLEIVVDEILEKVKEFGDSSLLKFSEKFDFVKLTNLQSSLFEIKQAQEEICKDLKESIEIARRNIESFHQAQLREEFVEVMEGIKCWRKNIPIETVGFYIPSGSAPLFSTVLMLAIPARIAGCKEIILCAPSDKKGKIASTILYVADLLGIQKIYKVGGAQAIAAMAYGTETIPKVDKIFGPGNQFVTKAKQKVQSQGIAIDLLAGPSELLVIADETCSPAFVAADLLAQAEHGNDSQVLLLSDNREVIFQVNKEIEKQLLTLPRKKSATQSLKNGFALSFDSLEQCFDFSNQYAPEHLSLAIKDPSSFIQKIMNAGSVFLGNYSAESIGD